MDTFSQSMKTAQVFSQQVFVSAYWVLLMYCTKVVTLKSSNNKTNFLYFFMLYIIHSITIQSINQTPDIVFGSDEILSQNVAFEFLGS